MFKIYRSIKCLVCRKITRNLHTDNKLKNDTLPQRFGSLIFGKYLLHTNIISSGVLMWIGDICQQEIEYRQGKLQKRYDSGRMTRMLIVGLALGPLHHYYYLYLAKIMPKRDMKTVFIKIGLDQFFMGPLCIGAFFYSMGVLERKSLEKINAEVMDKFLSVYLVDWLVWVPTQFVNFYVVPVKYQVFYINAVTMLYNVFLSYIKHVDAEQPDQHLNVVHTNEH